MFIAFDKDKKEIGRFTTAGAAKRAADKVQGTSRAVKASDGEPPPQLPQGEPGPEEGEEKPEEGEDDTATEGATRRKHEPPHNAGKGAKRHI